MPIRFRPALLPRQADAGDDLRLPGAGGGVMAPKAVKPNSRVSRLYEVMDLMLDSVGDPLALKSLAASASYSSYHFDRIFRELTGFSAVEYQRKRRLRRAAHQLRHEPDVPVFRIAQDCGFPSNAAFAKAF